MNFCWSISVGLFTEYNYDIHIRKDLSLAGKPSFFIIQEPPLSSKASLIFCPFALMQKKEKIKI